MRSHRLPIYTLVTLLSVPGCGGNTEEDSQETTDRQGTVSDEDKQKWHLADGVTYELAGSVLSVDEDAVWVYSGHQGEMFEFKYEVVRVQSEEGVRDVVVPQPSNIRFGDQLELSVKNTRSLSLQNLVDQYVPQSIQMNGNLHVVQNGPLQVAGVVSDYRIVAANAVLR